MTDSELPAHSLGLFVSGRASFEMVQKAWAGGFATVVAVNLLTYGGVEWYLNETGVRGARPLNVEAAAGQRTLLRASQGRPQPPPATAWNAEPVPGPAAGGVVDDPTGE